jgi:hypothetical protein
MSSESSSRQYGGMNNLEYPYAVFNTISLGEIKFEGQYQGNFDICGNLNIGESIDVNKGIRGHDLFLGNSITISKDLRVYGSIYSSKDIFLNLGNFNDLQSKGNTILGGNSYVYDRLYLDSRDLIDSNGNVVSYRPLGNIFFKGKQSLLGLNVENPQYMLDIYGNTSNVLSVLSSQENTKNIISQNVNNKGIVVESNTLSSSIKLYSENSINTNYPSTNADASITYNSGGNLTIDVSNNTNILSNVVISSVTNSHLLNETVIIYDGSSGITGNSLSLVSKDNNSSTRLNIIKPDKSGFYIDGGSYPKDNSNLNGKLMGTMGILDTCGNYIPSQMFVSGNNPAKYRSTLGINTYAPRIDNYVVDINGPVHITNGQLAYGSIASFEIKSITKTTNLYGTLIATGTPSSIFDNTLQLQSKPQDYKQNILYSNNYGQSWKTIIIDPSNSSDNFHQTPIELYGSYTYDNSFSIICGENSFVWYTVNGGNSWFRLLIDGYSNKIFKSILIDELYIYLIFDTELIYFNNPYTNKPQNDTFQDFNNPNNKIFIINSNYPKYSIDFGSSVNDIYSNNTNIFAVGGGFISIINKTTFGVTTITGSNTYNAVFAKDSNVIAVGVNIISYSTNNGDNWTHNTIT